MTLRSTSILDGVTDIELPVPPHHLFAFGFFGGSFVDAVLPSIRPLTLSDSRLFSRT